jgi:TPR repeat protein
MYRFGSGVKRDVLAAGSHYRMGCDDGVAPACRQLATMFYYGDGLTQDLGQAVKLYSRGCDAGDQRSCSLLGDLFMTSSGDFHEPKRAVSLFLRACEGDDIAGCIAHVKAIEFGVGVSPDVVDAIARKHRLCDRSPALCGQLGVSYLAGRGVNTNADAARRLLTKSCAALPNEKRADAWGEADLYAFYSCLVVERRFGGPGASPEQKAAMAARIAPVLELIAQRCHEESAFECFDGGYLLVLAGKEEGAQTLWERGCQFRNQESCDALEAGQKHGAPSEVSPSAPEGSPPAETQPPD